MPWFDPQPTPAETDFWLFRPGGRHKVSRWPTTGTDRTNTRFRLHNSSQFDPMALQWLVHFKAQDPLDNPNQPTTDRWGYFDLSWDGTGQFLTSGLIGEIDGWNARIEIEDFDVGGPGIPRVVVRFLYETPQSPFHREGLSFLTFEKDGNALKRSLYSDTDPNDGRLDQLTIKDSYGDWAFDIFAVSDCYDFPTPGGPPVGGFGEFNGIDAYIFYGTWPFWVQSSWKIEWDIRMHEDVQTVILGDHTWASSFTGYQGFDTIRFWNELLDTDNPLIPGQWHTVRTEKNWTLPNNRGYTFLDGVPNGDRPLANQTIYWSQLGKRANDPVGIEGVFDLRNLKIWSGTEASPVLRTDMPLQDNACDLAAPSFHPETFNMSLPSCPP